AALVVVVDCALPLSLTVTPGFGLPRASRTVPEIEIAVTACSVDPIVSSAVPLHPTASAHAAISDAARQPSRVMTGPFPFFIWLCPNVRVLNSRGIARIANRDVRCLSKGHGVYVNHSNPKHAQ